jgi:hypothetical protein
LCQQCSDFACSGIGEKNRRGWALGICAHVFSP